MIPKGVTWKNYLIFTLTHAKPFTNITIATVIAMNNNIAPLNIFRVFSLILFANFEPRSEKINVNAIHKMRTLKKFSLSNIPKPGVLPPLMASHITWNADPVKAEKDMTNTEVPTAICIS